MLITLPNLQSSSTKAFKEKNSKFEQCNFWVKLFETRLESSINDISSSNLPPGIVYKDSEILSTIITFVYDRLFEWNV